ncbi:MAG TPA: Gfo/Idh/MocA family oxidoreductase [Dehalococcoidia bacterium]|nr:Gfo/Idh/MocA family oxidoreductase [Dehalococcoidia bacterium]
MRPRIGVIGGGVMGTTHGKAIHYLIKNGIVDAEIVAVADEDGERLDRYQRVSGAKLATRDARELIASSGVNTVYVCTPTFSHLELVREVAGRGKALFCEKPLAFNAQDAATMADVAARAGITHQVGLVLRFSPVINVMRQLIASPESGRAMTCVMVDDQFFPITGHYGSTWRGDVRYVGAGTLLEHAIHDIDVLQWYFGAPHRVFGVTRAFFGKPGIEDTTSTVLEFPSGAVVSHTSVWHNLLHRGSTRRMHVICENAQYWWQDDDYSGPIVADSNETGAPAEIPRAGVVRRFLDAHDIPHDRLRDAIGETDLGWAYLLEDYAFLRAVAGDRPAAPSFDVAVAAHRTVDAIYESARISAPVELK